MIAASLNVDPKRARRSAGSRASRCRSTSGRLLRPSRRKPGVDPTIQALSIPDMSEAPAFEGAPAGDRGDLASVDAKVLETRVVQALERGGRAPFAPPAAERAQEALQPFQERLRHEVMKVMIHRPCSRAWVAMVRECGGAVCGSVGVSVESGLASVVSGAGKLTR